MRRYVEGGIEYGHILRRRINAFYLPHFFRISFFNGNFVSTGNREIEGGKETISVKLPAVVAGQKGLVDEKDLIIPNMRGIMSARTKPLQVVEPSNSEVKVEAVSFDSVAPRAAVKLVSADNLDELVRLLHEEAKVI